MDMEWDVMGLDFPGGWEPAERGVIGILYRDTFLFFGGLSKGHTSLGLCFLDRWMVFGFLRGWVHHIGSLVLILWDGYLGRTHMVLSLLPPFSSV